MFIHNGMRTLLSCSAVTQTNFILEKVFTPPEIDGGEPIDISNMRSEEFHTFWSRFLKTLMPHTIECQYDPSIYDVVSGFTAYVNVNQMFTVEFPDTSSIVYWGFFRKGTPTANKEGDEPMCSVTIVPSMVNPALSENQAIPGMEVNLTGTFIDSLG